MVSETRYFRSDSATVNGLNCRKLLTARSGTAGELTINVYEGNVTVTQYLGIRVWVRTVDGVETEVDPVAVKAIGSRGTSGLTAAATYTPTQTVLNATDSIVVRVYTDDFSPPTTYRGVWQTEQLNETQLDALEWSVYYYVRKSYSGGITTYRFSFDTATYNSRIDNFSHSTPTAGGMQLFTLINQEDY